MQRLLTVIGMLLALSGCISPSPSQVGTTADHIEATLNAGIANNRAQQMRKHRLPSAVSNALIPKMAIELPKSKGVEHRFDIAVHDVAAKTFFMGLVKGTEVNMVVSPKVSGSISLNLKNVTIAEVMDSVRDTYGYDYRKTRSGYEVMPNGIQTRIFTVNYLDAVRKGQTQTSLSSGQITEKITGPTGGSSSSSSSTSSSSTTSSTQGSGSSVETTSKVDFWDGLAATVKTLIGSGGGRSVVVNPQAGLVVVRAFPAELRSVAHYLDSLQTNMSRQVILEAKILEVELKDGYQAGIDWNSIGLKQTGNIAFPGAGIKTFTKFLQYRHNKPDDFKTTIQLLENQGNVQVLSSPRVATLNNQKAVIKVGSDEFFVTSVSTETGSSDSSTSQDVELTPFFSGITLDVTPQISPEGMVILHIHPSVSKVSDQNKQITVGSSGDLDLPLALSTIRESDSVVRAENGQVIVLGGLMENKMTERTASAPGIDDIPFIGTLFRRTDQTAVRTELVILLKPIVVTPKTWNKRLAKSAHRVEKLNRGFHIGGHPRLFGTEAEGRKKI